jgi:protein-tyrosine phosphatase
MKVLFVCTGNICRSPTARVVLERLAEDAGLALQVDSAGTHGYHVGEPPDERAQAHARRRGYDLSGQRARRVAVEDFERFDLILAMDRGHLRILERQCPPQHRPKLRLCMDFAQRAGGDDVPDPYYGGADGFEQALDMIEDACRGVLDSVRGATS